MGQLSQYSTLRYELVTVHRVSAHELNRFIQHETGVEIDVAAAQGWSSFSEHLLMVTGLVTDYQAERYQVWLQDGCAGGFTLKLILNFLCREGKLPVGQYLIEVL